MRTNLLYVLVSNETDIYLEQLFVSITSAKYYMPDCHVIVLTDSITSKTFTGIREKEISIADEIVVVDLDSKVPAQKRSRILKTGARNYLTGDFLFIDCDTIIIKDLSPIDNYNQQLMACWDTHALFIDNPYRGMCIDHGHLLGLQIDQEKYYYNSGVILARDTKLVKEFYKKWNEYYLIGYEKGVKMDQPSFQQTNISMGYPVETMPDVWNCELRHGIRYLKDAFIVHYLCTNVTRGKKRQLFILNDLDIFKPIKDNCEIPEVVWETIKDPFKGISPITECFGENSVGLFHTQIFGMLNYRYNNGQLAKIDLFIKKLSRLYNKIIRKIGMNG